MDINCLIIKMDQYNILFEIFHKLDFKSQLALIFTCSTTKNNLFIIDLYHIEEKYLELLDDNFLKHDIFQQTRKLKANKKITNVSFMKNLKILDASIRCGIGQDGIMGLDLIELNASSNNKITDVSFMKNLKVLSARGMIVELVKMALKN